MNKPLSRRLFGTAMAAVPLAVSEAPKLAASAATPNTAGLAGPCSQPPADTMGQKPPSELEWRAKRTKELQAIIDGKEDDFDREINVTPFIAHHYDSLRSLSPSARAVLFHRESVRRARLQRVSWAQKELQNLIRRFF